MIETTSEMQDRRVGDIAAQLPGASAVFQSFGIDFCCQGHMPLSDAANHRNLDPGKVYAALDALDPEAPPEAPSDTDQLIDHIRTRYHDVHRRAIPLLIAQSRKVEARHMAHPQVPAGLAQTLQQFLGELENLMTQQEAVQFPALRNRMPDQLALSIRLTRHDHNEFAFFLDRIDRLTDDCTAPEDACVSWRVLYADLARFKADLMQHIHLENNVLFPRFETTGRG